MKVIVEQCSRQELLEYISTLEERLEQILEENYRIRREAQEHYGCRLMLEDTIHELGAALDNVNDILNIYYLSTVRLRDDEK